MSEATVQVLFVDDEPEILRAFSRDLESWGRLGDVKIGLLPSGEECLKYLEQHHQQVRVVATDLRMNGMQGTELLHHIHQQYPDIGLLLITAYSDIEAIQEAVAAAISGFILKPWEPEQLAKQVETTLNLVESRRATERYVRELEHHVLAAAEFQQKVLHPEPVASARLELGVHSQAAREPYCTGDYYDIVHLSNDQSLLIIGDVSGHGIKAAFVTGMIKVLSSKNIDALRNIGSNGRFSVTAFLTKLNRDIFHEMPSYSDVVISMSVVLLDFETSTMTVANAGHLPVMLLYSEGCQRVLPDGPAMGFHKNSEYTEHTTHIGTGDRVVMFTDGLTEVGGGLSPIPDQDLIEILQACQMSHNKNPATEQEFCASAVRKVAAFAVEHDAEPDSVFRDDLTILSALMR